MAVAPWRRWLRLVALAAALFAESELHAHELVVQVWPLDVSGSDLVSDLTAIPTQSPSPEALRLQAILLINGTAVDVSGDVQWAIDDQGIAVLDGQRLTFVERGTVVVTAHLDGMAAPLHVTYEPHSDLVVPRADPPDDEAIDGFTLYLRALEMVEGLEGSGIPVDALRDAVEATRFADDLGAFERWLTGDAVNVCDADTGGIFLPRGFSLVHVTLLVKVAQDTVVLRHDHAVSAADGELIVNGRLTAAAQVLLEEIMHAMVFQADLDIPENAEEQIVKELVQNVVPAFINIHLLLQIDNPTQLDLVRLRRNIERIKRTLDYLRQEHGELLDLILEALGWEDVDQDGVPDLLEDMLEDAGIDDWTTLPKTIPDPDDGDCGPMTPSRPPTDTSVGGDDIRALWSDRCGNVFAEGEAGLYLLHDAWPY